MKNLTLLLLLTSFSLFAQENTIDNTKKTMVNDYDNDLLPAEFFAKNRQALRDSMPKNSVVVLFAAPIRNRSNDVNYEYHQNPNFYYLTGLREPHAALIIFKEDQEFEGNLKTNEILFLQKKDKKNEIWTGKRLGIEGGREKLGLTTTMENKDFLSFNNEFHRFNKVLIFEPDEAIRNMNEKGDLYGMVQSFKLKTQNLKNIDTHQLSLIMASLRQVKSEEEIALLKKATDITCDAQIELMKALNPGMTEYQSEAIVEYIFKKNGAEYPGFPSILGGGENSCVIHYNSNRKKLNEKDLLVSDIGAEYHGYTADITRTLPVDGTFSEEERIIYNIVLKAQQAGIDSCRAGNKFWAPHNAANKVITDELIKLGIIEKRYHVQKYFMHGTSHYLGLDVHDMGLNNVLTPGNVITVEPGIYIPEGSDCDPKWWNIGIRIEDDILITIGDPVNISEKAPRTIEEIEQLMKEEGNFK